MNIFDLVEKIDGMIDKIDNVFINKYSKIAKKEEEKKGTSQFDLAKTYVKIADVSNIVGFSGISYIVEPDERTIAYMGLGFGIITNRYINSQIKKAKKKHEEESLDGIKKIDRFNARRNRRFRLMDKYITYTHTPFIPIIMPYLYNKPSLEGMIALTGFAGLLLTCNYRSGALYLIDADPKAPAKDSVLTKAWNKVKEHLPSPKPVPVNNIEMNKEYRTLDSLL